MPTKSILPEDLPSVEEAIERLKTLPRVDQFNLVAAGPIRGMDISLCPRGDCNCRRRRS